MVKFCLWYLIFDYLDNVLETIREEIMERRKKFLIIKKDLELLEIFKKNIITIQSEPDVDYGGFHDDMFEIIIDRSFKTEDFNKLKQWLEENE